MRFVDWASPNCDNIPVLELHVRQYIEVSSVTLIYIYVTRKHNFLSIRRNMEVHIADGA